MNDLKPYILDKYRKKLIYYLHIMYIMCILNILNTLHNIEIFLNYILT